jgi:hypothetical protein
MKLLVAVLAVILTATPALAQNSGSNRSGYIPDPNDEQALAAFNDLQDQFGRPHADRLTYHAKDDSYHWVGPKYHKPMKMARQEFDVEVWYPYWKKQHPTVEAPRAELVATPTPEPTPERITPVVSATPKVTSQSSSVGGFLVALIFLIILIWGLFKFLGKIFGSVASSTPPPLPVNNEDLTRQMKTLQVLLLANQPGAENAIECLRNPRVDCLNVSDSTGHVMDLKGENGEPWLIPYRCPQYMPRKGEIVLWGFDNVKYYHQGTHSEWQGWHAGVSDSESLKAFG